MPRATQPVSINGLEFDALISQNRSLSATVPQYSVEDGFSVSDSIILDPEKMDMVLYVTNTPVTWYRRHGASQDRVNSVCKQIEEIYFAKEPVTIVTSEATYTDMAIEALTISKTTEDGYSRQIQVSFVKIRVTSAKTTTIPDSYGKSGATGAQTGTANTSAGSSGSGGGSGGGSSGGGSGSGGGSSSGNSKSSILFKAANGLGLI